MTSRRSLLVRLCLVAFAGSLPAASVGHAETTCESTCTRIEERGCGWARCTPACEDIHTHAAELGCGDLHTEFLSCDQQYACTDASVESRCSVALDALYSCFCAHGDDPKCAGRTD